MKSNYLIIGLVALATAATIFELAANDSDPRQQVRIIDVPHLTHADALRLGIEPLDLSQPGDLYRASEEVRHARATLTPADISIQVKPRISSSIAIEPDQEVKPAPGRTRPASSPPVQIKTRERNDGHSRANQVGPVAQRIEQPRPKGKVAGSNPAWPATSKGWIPVEISVYSAKYHNRRTASGERYDHHRGFTAATTRRANGWDLPRGSTWEVNYRGKTVIVRINDTGSTKPRMAPYWLDLSGRAYADLTNGAAPSRFKARMRRVK